VTEYVTEFTTPWVLTGVSIVLAIAVVITLALRHPLGSTGRRWSFFAFVVSAGIVVVATLVREPPQVWCTGCLVPDWGLPRFLNGDLGAEGVLNVALFVPVALFAVLIWQTPILTVIVAAMGSMVIELLQPMLGVGVNDLTDLAANAAGAIIGATAAAMLLLIADSLRARRWFAARTVRVIVAVVIVAAMVSGIGRLLALHPRAQDDLVPVATPGILRC
jgi:hypothetical protein